MLLRLGKAALDDFNPVGQFLTGRGVRNLFRPCLKCGEIILPYRARRRWIISTMPSYRKALPVISDMLEEDLFIHISLHRKNGF